MKIFFDTNVLVSTYTDFEEKGTCCKLTDFVLRNPHHQFIVAEIILEEFERVMARFKIPSALMQEILLALREEEVIPTSKKPIPVSVRDPDDIHVLASALEAQADVLVTGDKDLLILGDTAGIKIVDPRTLWEMLTKEE